VAVHRLRDLHQRRLQGLLLTAAGQPLGEAAQELFAGPVTETSQIETASLARDSGFLGFRYFTDEYAFAPYRAKVKVSFKYEDWQLLVAVPLGLVAGILAVFTMVAIAVASFSSGARLVRDRYFSGKAAALLQRDPAATRLETFAHRCALGP
jgi:hypothetical protein